MCVSVGSVYHIYNIGPYLVVASKESGPGKLTVNVRAGGADVDSLIREGDNGVYEIVFHPTRAAPHKVHIKYNDVHISGIYIYMIQLTFE